jgi:hypothetical protein
MAWENVGFEAVLAFMPDGWKEEAKEPGALVLAREVKTAKGLLRLVLLYLTAGKSFGGASALSRMGGDYTLNKAAVWKRVKGSAEWLRWLDERLRRRGGRLGKQPEWLEGKDARLADGSIEPASGKNGRLYNSHYRVSLFSLEMKEMPLADVKEEGEKLSGFKSIAPGQIMTGGRAYGTIQGMERVRGNGADFIPCLRAGAFNVYNQRGEKTPLSRGPRRLTRGESAEKTVYYLSDGKYKPVRIRVMRKDRSGGRAGLERMEKTSRRKHGERNPARYRANITNM